MALFKTLLILLPFFVFSEEAKYHSLYLMQQNQVTEAFEQYCDFSDKSGRYDFETLQQMGLILLQHGMQSTDSKSFMMTLFGAGLCGSVHALDILENGLWQEDPQIQLIALHFIAKMEDDRALDLLSQAMASDYLAIRMEAAYYLAQKKHPLIVGQIEALMHRLPPILKPFFPSLFALCGTNEATNVLKRLIEDNDPATRVESILHVARLGRDDFLPLLRKRLTHTNIAEVEAAAFAMGALKDSNSLHRLKKLANSPIDTIKLAACSSLFALGDRSTLPTIATLARNGNLFAIAALGTISETEEILAEILDSKNLHIRLNAAISLLQRHDDRCLPVLFDILIDDVRNLAFIPTQSIGKTLTAFKAVPSAEIRAKDKSIDLSYSLAIREKVLTEALHLPEKAFLQLARAIFRYQQNDLVPSVVALLENLQTEGAKKVLKEGANRLGAPFIRDYCHLALFRLDEPGPYEAYINRWVLQQKEAPLIQFKPLLPWKYRFEQAGYSLTPDETSRLLIEAFVSIAIKRDQKSISFLLQAIQNGNQYNRYALMGLLMKATE